jgi:hypothetical protein
LNRTHNPNNRRNSQFINPDTAVMMGAQSLRGSLGRNGGK